jgi:hypothetical protein
LPCQRDIIPLNENNSKQGCRLGIPTALHLAVECCKPQVVQTLLGFGAQVELKGGKVYYKNAWKNYYNG